MKYASVGSDTHPTAKVAAELAKFLAERSNGELELTVFRNSSLGGDRQVTEGMQIGTVEMGVVGSSVLVAFEPKVGVFDFPFIFKTEEAAYKALDGDVGDTIRELLLKKGLRVLAYGTNGYRHMTNSRNPVHKPEDLKGLKIRTMENPIFIETFKLMGASPTPMSFSELFTALQQKTVDAQENPILLIYSSKLYEVQKYISKTGHVYAVAPLLMGEKFFQSLPPEHQKTVLEGGKFFEKRQREMMHENEALFEEAMKKAGVEINELTPEEKDEFVKACQEVYAKFEASVGRDLLDRAIKAND
ncbi:MAG: DctP family TRAP transporter solute-binding subunit [Synergistaceae bacterium]|nr:DctP family TRAP transporter solute-binding subunit [Synergistaceae bacterium]